MGGTELVHLAGRELLMAVDKLVDSTQLDSDLTSVANAIRTKGGTSAQLTFPTDFVSAIQNLPSGGGGGLTLLGSGSYTKASDSASINIPVTYTGTPKEYYYYITDPTTGAQQTIFGYNRVLANSDLSSILPDGDIVAAHRVKNASDGLSWSSSAQVMTLSSTTMTSARPGSGNTHKAGTYKWYIYG